jgi:hypothetical protein
VKIKISATIVSVLLSGRTTPARMMNDRTSDMVTDERMRCPVAVLRRLYCKTSTDTSEIDGMAIARATMKSAWKPKEKNTKDAKTVSASGTRKLVTESREALNSLPRTMWVFISNPMWNIIKNNATDETAFTETSVTIRPKTDGPMIMPLRISPTTEGRQNCSNSSPTRSAAASTISTSVIIGSAKISAPEFRVVETTFSRVESDYKPSLQARTEGKRLIRRSEKMLF